MKKRGMKKRVLAALMTACMVVGSVPGVSLADVSGEPSGTLRPDAWKYNFDGSTSEEEDPDIELKKTAQYDAEKDEYIITLNAKAREAVTTNKTHVVFLLDASGSMNWCADNSVPKTNDMELSAHYHYFGNKYHGVGFQQEYSDVNGCTLIDRDNGKTKSRWKIATDAIQTMKTQMGTDGIKYDFVYFSDQPGDSTATIPYSDHTKIEGGTYLTAGVKYALSKFEEDSDVTDKVLIIVADGETDDRKDVLSCGKDEYWNSLFDFHKHNVFCYKSKPYYPKNELAEFQSEKNGKVYTVGFTFSNDDFKNLANSPAYNYNAADENALKIALNSISEKIQSGIVDNLGSNVKLADNNRITVDGSDVEASYDGKTITWNDPKGLDANGVTITYRVKVTTTTCGPVDLNGTAKLNYTYKGEKHEVDFPTPSVDGAKLNVKFVTENVTPVDIKGEWIDWIGLTSSGVKFRNITKIPNTFTGTDEKQYYLESVDDPSQITTYSETTNTYAISSPTQAKEYVVTVTVTENIPQPENFTVIYDADGGQWDDAYVPDLDYELNSDRSQLTRTNVTADDMIEVLAGENAPKKQEYTFKGWQLVMGTDSVSLFRPMRVGQVASKVEGQENAYKAYVKAIWEKDGSSEKNNITYSVNQHYIAPDHTDNVSIEDLTAGKDDSIKDAISGYTKDLQWRDDKYLYRRTTVTTGGKTVDYDPDNAKFTEDTTIDIYYYRDSWNAEYNSETGGDGTPDTEQVLVKFGSKVRGDWVTGSGIVQVYRLVKGQTTVTPSMDNVTVSCDEGYHFTKWTKNNSENEIYPLTEQTGVKGGETINFWAWFAADEVKVPDGPTEDELKDLIEVALVHTGSNAHPNGNYTLITDSYDVETNGSTAVVTVKADKYVKEYNSQYGEHAVQGKDTAKLVFDHTGAGWELVNDNAKVSFTVKCSEKKPESPKGPTKEDLKKLFGNAITVICTTDADHAEETFGLIDGSFHFSKDKDVDDEGVVTVNADKYIKAFNDGNHTNAGDDGARVKLYYDANEAKWCADQDINITFKAKCEKKAPEKQYTEIKFVVVNGTFTENGQTELTKTFEVGTKLTLADIPASKGKSSSYSDQTWDKFPVGYVVGKDGTTFTITYRWRSSGSDSDDSDYDYGTSTRGKATNAAGKSGRWILEGGEFTEDNGRLPSNEYLKIGDTIYGFYTYGFAIDFDRPEYYTDAAIQAKGGYRDATGTWRLNGWWFCYDDGTFPHDEWVYLTWNGRSDWYYFDVDGWMEDSWLYRNNNWYYLHTQYDNTRGHMYTGWHEIDGKWYYFNTASDKGTLGAMLANTTTPDGYQVDANGAWIR